MYLVSLHGQATSCWPGSSGAPTECRAGHEVGVELLDPSQDVGAHPGHDPHRHDDVRRVGDLDAEHRVLGVEVAHDERDDVHGATAHAAAVEVGHDRLHLGRRHPVVGGAGVGFSSTEQMKVRSSTRATSLGSEAQWNELGFLSGLSRVNVPASTSSSVSRVHSSSEPVTQWIAVGGGQRGDLVDPGRSRAWVVLPSLAMSVPAESGWVGSAVVVICCAIPFAAPSWRPTSVAMRRSRGPRRGGCPHAERVLMRPTYARRGGRDTGNLSAVGETAHKDSGSCRVSDIPLSKRTPPTGNQQKASSIRRLTSRSRYGVVPLAWRALRPSPCGAARVRRVGRSGVVLPAAPPPEGWRRDRPLPSGPADFRVGPPVG